MRNLPTVLVLAAAWLAAPLLPLSAQTPAAAPTATAAAKAAPADPATVLYPRSPSGLGQTKDSAGLGGVTMTVFVVLAGAAGGWLLWRRLRGGVSVAGRSEHQLAIAETRSLGNRQYLVVASYGDRRFLLGVCPGKIDLISPLENGPPSSTS
jgi:flagellar protein FliO/FliZ